MGRCVAWRVGGGQRAWQSDRGRSRGLEVVRVNSVLVLGSSRTCCAPKDLGEPADNSFSVFCSLLIVSFLWISLYCPCLFCCSLYYPPPPSQHARRVIIYWSCDIILKQWASHNGRAPYSSTDLFFPSKRAHSPIHVPARIDPRILLFPSMDLSIFVLTMSCYYCPRQGRSAYFIWSSQLSNIPRVRGVTELFLIKFQEYVIQDS